MHLNKPLFVIFSTDEGISIRQSDRDSSNSSISLKWLSNEKIIAFCDVRPKKPA
jgi:hypothetical protein